MAKSVRTYIDIPNELFADVEVFQKAKRCQNRAEAIRRLIDAAIWKTLQLSTEGFFNVRKPVRWDTAYV